MIKLMILLFTFTVTDLVASNLYYKSCAVTVDARNQYVTAIRNGNMDAGFNSIRFTNTTGDTSFDYWIERKTADTAFVWVDLKSKRSIGYTFRMSYGDTSLSTKSNIYKGFGRYRGTNFSKGALYDVNRHAAYDGIISATAGNYEAWPAMAWSLDKKKIYCVYRSTKGTATHGFDSSGYFAMRVSYDTAVTWSDESIIADSAGWDDRDGTVFVYSDNDTEVVCVLYAISLYSGDSTNSLLIKSRDSGVTWSAPLQIGDTNKLTEGRGHPIFLSTGRLILPLYTYKSGEPSKVYNFYSDDSGTTWNKILMATSLASNYSFSEHSIIEIKTNGQYTGKLLSIIRNELVATNYNYYTTVSLDYGMTWSAVDRNTSLTMDGASPVELIRTSEDKLLLLYGKGTGRSYESSDEGVTWDSLAPFVTSAALFAGRAYPSVLEVDTNKFIIAWCTNGNPGNSDVFVQWYSDRAFYQVASTTDYPITHIRPDFSADTLYETYGATVRRTIGNIGYNPRVDSFIYFAKVKVNYNVFSGLRASSDANVIGVRGDAINRFVVSTASDSWYGLPAGNVPTENAWVTWEIKCTPTDIWIYENGVEKTHKTADLGNGIPNVVMSPGYYLPTNAAAYFAQDYGYLRDYTATIPIIVLGAEQPITPTTSTRIAKKSFKNYDRHHKAGFKNF